MTYGGSGLSETSPISIGAGATFRTHIADLHVGVGSAALQVQNVSPLPIQITIGTDTYWVTASQATTLPLPLPPNGAGVDYTLTNNTASTVTGSQTFVWLLDGQEPPQPDGPLTSAAATGAGSGGGEVNYALETGGNLQTLEQNFHGFSNGGSQVTYYDTDTTPVDSSGLLIMGSSGSTPGTAIPGDARAIQVDTVGRLVLSPTSAGAVSIVSPVDGSGYVQVDLELVGGAAVNLAKETGGNLASILTADMKTASIVANGGSAAPTPVAQVGGIQQGTGFLQPLVLDASQNLLVNVQSLPSIQLASQGTPGSPVPASALQIAGSDGTDLRTLATDTGGQLKVLIEGGTGSPVTIAAPSNTSNISATSVQVKNAAGTLYGVTGYSSIAQFFQLLDATSLVSGTTVPKVSIPIPAAGGFALDYGDRGRAFATGIYAAYSSTQAVFTTGTAGTIDAQFV